MTIKVTEDHIRWGFKISFILGAEESENPIELALNDTYNFSWFTTLPCGFVIRDFLGIFTIRAPNLPKNAENWLDNWIDTDDGEPFELEYNL